MTLEEYGEKINKQFKEDQKELDALRRMYFIKTCFEFFGIAIIFLAETWWFWLIMIIMFG